MSGNGGRSILKSSFAVAMATLASRLLGLIRVRLEATVLGGGVLASGWFNATMIPNLFRRLLGEGALGTALIPLIAEIEAKEGLPEVRRQLTVVFAALGIVLALIVVVVSGGSWLILHNISAEGEGFFQRDYIRLTLELLPLLMPYAFFICLVGVIGAVVNYAKIFVIPALLALLLNIFLICGLGAAWYWVMEPQDYMPILALLVPFSGVVHLIVMLILLYRCGRFPAMKRDCFKDCSVLKKLWKLSLPGFLSYGALQISFVIDRTLAATLGARAVPAMNYVDRIIDLPIGIFAVSLGTVLMSAMARSAASGNVEEIRRELAFSLRHVWFICLPLAAMVVFFHEPILRVLCLGGRYTQSDLEAAELVAVFYGMGIPFFCSLKVIHPAFYARKKMKTPLVVSLIAITTNVVLNLILMRYLAQAGLALATVIASLLNNTLLFLILRHDGFAPGTGTFLISMVRSAVLSFGCCWGVFCIYGEYIKLFARSSYFNEIFMLAAAGGVFAVVYFVLSAICRAAECREIMSILNRRS